MKSTIIGNLGKDCEVRVTSNNTTIATFSIADTVGFGDKQKTQWVRCNLFGKRAEGKLVDYLLKGTTVVVFGEVSVNEYVDKSGANRWQLECHVDDIKLVGGKKDSASTPAQSTQNSVAFDDSDDIPF